LFRPVYLAGETRFQSWKTSQIAVRAGIKTQARTPRIKGLIKMYPVSVRLPRSVLNQRIISVIEYLFLGSRASDKLIALSIEVSWQKGTIGTQGNEGNIRK
jgi:hypothetical protein